MSGMEGRLEELTNFQSWAVNKLEEEEKRTAELKIELNKVREVNKSLLRRLDDVTTIVQVRGDCGRGGVGDDPGEQSQETGRENEVSSKRDVNDCSSPTSPGQNVDRYHALRGNPPCPPAGLWDNTTSEDSITVEERVAATKTRSTSRQPVVRPGSCRVSRDGSRAVLYDDMGRPNAAVQDEGGVEDDAAQVTRRDTCAVARDESGRQSNRGRSRRTTVLHRTYERRAETDKDFAYCTDVTSSYVLNITSAPDHTHAAVRTGRACCGRSDWRWLH